MTVPYGRGPPEVYRGPCMKVTPLNRQLWFTHALVEKIYPDKVVRWCTDSEFLAIFLHPVFSASRWQHISDLHFKFALRPHYVWKCGSHPICDCWEQERKKTVKNTMWADAQRDGCPAEYRWRPLLNAAKFGWRRLLECRALTLPIYENARLGRKVNLAPHKISSGGKSCPGDGQGLCSLVSLRWATLLQ